MTRPGTLGFAAVILAFGAGLLIDSTRTCTSRAFGLPQHCDALWALVLPLIALAGLAFWWALRRIGS